MVRKVALIQDFNLEQALPYPFNLNVFLRAQDRFDAISKRIYFRRRKFMLKFQKDVCLKNYSTFKIGGRAKYFISVENSSQLIESIDFAKKKKIPFFVLGGGSNTLFSDKGYNGLVIKMETGSLEIKNTEIIVDAGLPLSEVVGEAAKNEFSNLEWAAGIPGTVGGAVYGNAGAFGGEIKNVIKTVTVLEILDFGFKTKSFKNKDCKFSYRNSLFRKNKKYIIIKAEIEFQRGKIENIKEKIKKNILYRNEHHPFEFPSAGSIFKNPEIGVESLKLIKKFPDFEKFLDRGEIPAAYLIDKCEFKGKEIGGAQVSDKHPNFIVNKGGGKAENVIILISLIKQKVRNKFGFQLKEEINYIGF